ncbi:guanine-N(1)--methyltransferase [Peziza echinospora]|nr:guanine-N(1)--methyltransferase [Peziza echinospora]
MPDATENTTTTTTAPEAASITTKIPTTTTTTATDAPARPDGPLSKNALKRQRREQLWLEKKAERKAIQKLKRKEAAQARRLQKQQESSTNTNESTTTIPTSNKRKAEDEPTSSADGGEAAAHGSPSTTLTTTTTNKKFRPTPTLHPLTILIDCSFDDLMTPKEIISLSSQITRCYADNRLSPHQAKLSITSLNKRLLHRMETALHNHHKNWKRVAFSAEDYPVTPENIASGDLIYLTSDSDDTLTELEDGKTYIVGGIVDRNRHKGICYKKAQEQGIRTAKLPIGEYIKMSSRFVLTTNQVVEIMLKWLELRDWEKAFLKVIPQRKQPKAKVGSVGEGEGEGVKKEEGGEEQEEDDGDGGNDDEEVETEERISEVQKEDEDEDADEDETMQDSTTVAINVEAQTLQPQNVVAS